MSGRRELEYVALFAPFGRLLDVGAGHDSSKIVRSMCQDYTGLDMQDHENVDIVHDLTEPLIGAGLFDDITCISTLEHCKYVWRVAENIEALLRPGGRLIVTVPFSWRIHDYPSDYWRMTYEGVRALFPRVAFAGVADHMRGPTNATPNGRMMVFAFGIRQPDNVVK